MATNRKPRASKSTQVTKWDEALAARAQIAKKAEESVSLGNFISLKSGVMSYNGNAIPGNKLDVIVIDSILENLYFGGAYDPNTPQSPICYAFGRAEDDMAPHEKVAEPFSEQCSDCQYNEWGSADTGRGKACRNVRRLAVIPADTLDDAQSITDAAVAYLKVPVTSVKAWAEYVNKLSAVNKPPLAFVTEISVIPDAGTQFKVSFNAVEAIEDGALIGALLAKADIVEQSIAFPYQPAEETTPPPAKPATRRKPEAKAAAAKPARRKF